jgi:hypothetical protein
VWPVGWGVSASRRVRLAARTGPFQGPETGSIPVRATSLVQVQVLENGAVAQSVRVPHCHCGGRGFEPRRPRCRFARLVVCPGGEIGRHAILRGWCRKASRFESASGHVPQRFVGCRGLAVRHSSSVVEHSIRNRAVKGSIPFCGSGMNWNLYGTIYSAPAETGALVVDRSVLERVGVIVAAGSCMCAL